MEKKMVIVQKRPDVRKDGPCDEEDALVQHPFQRDNVPEPEELSKRLRLQCRWFVTQVPDRISDKDGKTESLIFPSQKVCGQRVGILLPFSKIDRCWDSMGTRLSHVLFPCQCREDDRWSFRPDPRKCINLREDCRQSTGNGMSGRDVGKVEGWKRVLSRPWTKKEYWRINEKHFEEQRKSVRQLLGDKREVWRNKVEVGERQALWGEWIHNSPIQEKPSRNGDDMQNPLRNSVKNKSMLEWHRWSMLERHSWGCHSSILFFMQGGVIQAYCLCHST